MLELVWWGEKEKALLDSIHTEPYLVKA